MVRHTDEDFIHEEGVAVASVFTLQWAGKDGSEFDTPETDGFPAYCDASFGE
jgi:hypothetical protein